MNENSTDILSLINNNPLFDQSEYGIIVTSDCFIITNANDTAQNILDCSLDSLLDYNIHERLCYRLGNDCHDDLNCNLIHESGKMLVFWNSHDDIILNLDINKQSFIVGIKLFYVFYFEGETTDCQNFSKKNLERLTALSEDNPSPIVEFNSQSYVNYSNSAMIKLMVEHGVNKNGYSNILPENVQIIIHNVFSGQVVKNVETNYDGVCYLWDFYIDTDSSNVKAYGLNITYQKEIEKKLSLEKDRFYITLKAINDAVITVDTDFNIIFLNPAAEDLIGQSMNEVVNLNYASVLKYFYNDKDSERIDMLKKAMLDKETINSKDTLLVAHKEGFITSVNKTVTPMTNHKNEMIGLVITLHDVSNDNKIQEHLSFIATHDKLTGLINRNEFEDRIQFCIERYKKISINYVLLYIDLDNFKIINDTVGHIAGDHFLYEVGIILKKCLRKRDVIARLGGDEFGVLLENCDINLAVSISQNIINEIEHHTISNGKNLFGSGASIGIVSLDASYSANFKLVSLGNVACDKAKEMGKNRYYVFEQNNEEIKHKQDMTSWLIEINQALQENRFKLFYQLIYPIHHEESRHKIEILIRMQDKEGKIIPPFCFLEAAEKYNLMKVLDRWVVHNTLEWMDKNKNIVSVCSINLSGQSLIDDKFHDYVYDKLQNYSFEPGAICFEITETAAIQNITMAQSFIRRMKNIGCTFSLDDFGSGMSSFGYLQNLDIDHIKIDGMFVKDMINNKIDYAMVKSIHDIAKTMNLKTIAEYVESEKIYTELDKIGIDYAQGYLIAKPQSITELKIKEMKNESK